jgi:hypothetical protein
VRRFLMLVAVGVLSLIMTGSAQAWHPPGACHPGRWRPAVRLRVRYAATVSGPWVRRCWDDRCGCYIYWFPGSASWWYWCVPDRCYYPLDYCPYRIYSWQAGP